MVTDIKIFDSSIIPQFWEYGQNTLIRKDEWMDFDAKVGDTPISFSVTFDIEGTCKWSVDKGNPQYNEPDVVNQDDVDFDIIIKEVNSDVTLDIPSITETIKSRLKIYL